MEHNQTVGQRIRAKRHARGILLRQLSESTGLSMPYLSRVECGKRQPPLDTLGKIAAGLGCGVRSLIPTEMP